MISPRHCWKLIAFHPHSATTKWQGFFANMPIETNHWGILYPDAYSQGHIRYVYKVDVVDEMTVSQTLWNLNFINPFIYEGHSFSALRSSWNRSATIPPLLIPHPTATASLALPWPLSAAVGTVDDTKEWPRHRLIWSFPQSSTGSASHCFD